MELEKNLGREIFYLPLKFEDGIFAILFNPDIIDDDSYLQNIREVNESIDWG